MDFWDRFRSEIKKQNTTQEWVANQAGVGFPTLRGWINYDRMPNADQAVAIARVLGTTVEELVDGEDGRKRILAWAADNGAAYTPPPSIAPIITDLQTLTKEQLDIIAVQVRALASSNTTRSSKTAG